MHVCVCMLFTELTILQFEKREKWLSYSRSHFWWLFILPNRAINQKVVFTSKYLICPSYRQKKKKKKKSPKVCAFSLKREKLMPSLLPAHILPVLSTVATGLSAPAHEGCSESSWSGPLFALFPASATSNFHPCHTLFV